MATTSRPTKLPGFSNVPASAGPTAKVLREMQEAINIRLGRQGDPVDRAVTLRELIDSGLAVALKTRPYDPNNPHVTFKPPTGLVDLALPPAPTGFEASGGYSLVQVYWDYPAYRNHSYTEIYRFDADTIGDAILIAVSAGRSFIDPVGGGTSYYYWARHVNTSDVRGPFNDAAGTLATTATDVAHILGLLTGAVTDSQLTTTLLTRIDLIDDPIIGLGVTRALLLSDYYTSAGVDSTIAAVTALLASTAYVTAALGNYTDTATLTSTYYTSAGVDSAIAIAITSLASTAYVTAALGNYTNTATLMSAYYTAAGVDSAIALAITSLASTAYVTAALGNYTNTATLTSTYYTSAGVDSAIALAITSLASTAYVTAALGNYTNTATLTSTYYTSAGVDSAIAAAITSLASTAYVTAALGNYTNTAILTSTYYTKASAAVVEAGYMLRVNVNNRISGFGLASTADISEFVILADRFAIVNQTNNGNVIVPFIVTGATTINGESVPAGVYMNDAFIRNGTITNAKIGDAAIDAAKIASLNADAITSGTISTSRLNIDNSTLISVGGVLVLGNVTAANIVAGTITANEINGEAVSAIRVKDEGSAYNLPTDASYATVNTLSYTPESSATTLIIDFQIAIVCPGTGDYAAYVYIHEDGVQVGRLFAFYLKKSFEQYIQGKIVLTGRTAVSRAYTIYMNVNISGAGVSTATVNNSTLVITEAKR